MVLAADIPGLHVWADVAGVILLLELGILLVVVTALIFGIAFGLYWLHKHVMPLLDLTVPRAKQALAIANQGNDRVVRGIAAVYGFNQGLDAALRALLRPFRFRQLPATEHEPAALSEAAPDALPVDTLPVDVLAIPRGDDAGSAQRQHPLHAD